MQLHLASEQLEFGIIFLRDLIVCDSVKCKARGRGQADATVFEAYLRSIFILD